MPDRDRPSQGDDDEERDIQAMAESLREGLSDPGTRKHLKRLANAAMGDEPTDEPPATDAPPEP